MKNENYNLTDCRVYPGLYVPMLREDEVASALKIPHEGKIVIPPANVKELTDLFKVEIAVPGMRREDFLVKINENLLSVCVLHKENEAPAGEFFKLHEFNYECFDRHVFLPENADAAFVSAEYKEGILRLVVPKAKQPVKNQTAIIVVY